ncbi:MAG TPA: hypothetical protein VL021_01495 [Brumimicrobium sp.]|nr:hypothetical protein [Brumimicrobium sp.]
MKQFKIFLMFLFITILISSCSVEKIEQYNEDFIGQWRTDAYFSPTKGDSIRNYFTVDGSDSAFGVGCEIDDPFKMCLVLQTGRVKINKSSYGIQVGNAVDLIHYVQKEPFINDDGVWEMTIDNISFYKY